MAVESAIVALLEATAAVTDLVGTRIYPQDAPPDAALPYIVYRRGTPSERVPALSGVTGLNRAELELFCVSTNYAVAKSVANAVRVALDGKSGTYASTRLQGVFVEDGQDEFALQVKGSEIGERSVSLDVTAFHEE